MGSESDSAACQTTPKADRLGLCEVCNFEEAKYTCPKCEVKTCCLKCLNIHKKELNCSGIRDKTKFIQIKNMTNSDYMSDYTFLEECTRYVSDRKRDKLKRYTRFNKNLPSHLFKLRGAALERKISLRFLLANFSQHNANTTYYDWKTKVIHWRVEWVFSNASNVKVADERCNETEPLGKLVRKYINADGDVCPLTRKSLQFYQSRGFTGLRVLLKAEGVRRCKNRFFEMDLDKTLRENLMGKTVVEFPTIYVIYEDIAQEFETIDSDEDIEKETKMHMLELDQKYNSQRATEQSKSDAKIDGEMERLRIRKRKSAERRKTRAENPTNLLFSGDGSDQLSSSTDSGGNTEEETEEVDVSKKVKYA